jgi:hypothetical protein
MPELKYNLLNINNRDLVCKIISMLSELVTDKYPDRLKLEIIEDTYFHIPLNSIANSAGWYIIIDNNGCPLYIGTTANLHKRLNTNYGSLDNFRNSQRKTDSQRNFIKKYRAINIVTELNLIIISEKELLNKLNINNRLIQKLDRENIEKIMNIFSNKICANINND